MVYMLMDKAARVLQRHCLLCQGQIKHPTIFGLCEYCQVAVSEKGACCARCGRATAVDLLLCGECIKAPPAFDAVIALADYNFAIQTLIYGLKHQHDMACCRCLADLLAQVYHHQARSVDMLLCVPMHWRRLLERGNNHSALLARALSKKLSVPYLSNGIKKTRHTVNQRGLSAKNRHKNVRNAFMADAIVCDKTIMIVDDVMTTGSTAEAMAQALKKSGAKKVIVLVAARA